MDIGLKTNPEPVTPYDETTEEQGEDQGRPAQEPDETGAGLGGWPVEEVGAEGQGQAGEPDNQGSLKEGVGERIIK